jgi:hypothetical protein
MIFEKKLLGVRQLDIVEDAAAAQRWRQAILKLSNSMREAADEREHLSPVLMEALHNALENLLLLGDEADLMALEEWLDHEIATRAELRAAEGAASPSGNGYDDDKRHGHDRRFAERRFGERRQGERRTATQWITPETDPDTPPPPERRHTQRRDKDDRRQAKRRSGQERRDAHE